MRPLCFPPFRPAADEKDIDIVGSIAAHEFGHLIALKHPGAYADNPEELITVYSKNVATEAGPPKGPNSPAAYEGDVYSLMGRGKDLRWWMLQPWIKSLNGSDAEKAPWRIVANKTQGKYKAFYQNWQFINNRLSGFAKAALPDLAIFDQR